VGEAEGWEEEVMTAYSRYRQSKRRRIARLSFAESDERGRQTARSQRRPKAIERSEFATSQ
jgi:hypothetical protein